MAPNADTGALCNTESRPNSSYIDNSSTRDVIGLLTNPHQKTSDGRRTTERRPTPTQLAHILCATLPTPPPPHRRPTPAPRRRRRPPTFFRRFVLKAPPTADGLRRPADAQPTPTRARDRPDARCNTSDARKFSTRQENGRRRRGEGEGGREEEEGKEEGRRAWVCRRELAGRRSGPPTHFRRRHGG